MNPDDRRLIAACQAGRTDEFGELVRRYQDRLYHSVLRMLDSPDDAADVVQDSFINAYQSLNSFKGDSEFFTWLFRIAFNAAISFRRKKRATVSLDGNRAGEPIPHPADESSGSQPDERLQKFEDEVILQRALNRLSEDHRSAIVLKDIEGMKYEEMAEVLGIAVGTVRSRLNRARLELRQLLMENESLRDVTE
ncbi:MAG: sigma-70 family RNA polymerase sigma factor [Gemmataceae bacterium]